MDIRVSVATDAAVNFDTVFPVNGDTSWNDRTNFTSVATGTGPFPNQEEQSRIHWNVRTGRELNA